MLRAAKTRASKTKFPYKRSRAAAGPTTSTTATVAGDQPRAPLPSPVSTDTQSAPMDQVPNTPAPVGQGTDVFPTNPKPLCSVTDALGAHLPVNIRQSIFSNEFIHLHKLSKLVKSHNNNWHLLTAK